MPMSRRLTLLVAAMVAWTMLVATAQSEVARTQITFILVNDIYQMAEQVLPDGKARGGFARLAAVVKAESILPYLPPRKFWYSQEGQYGSYLEWNSSVVRSAETHLNVTSTLQKFGSLPNFLIVSVLPITLRPEYRLRLVYATQGTIFGSYNGDERYWVYKRNERSRSDAHN